MNPRKPLTALALTTVALIGAAIAVTALLGLTLITIIVRSPR